MLTEKRRERVLELVRQRGFASLPDLAGELKVSESTIRRDLASLEGSGSAKRTHGGVFYTGASPKLQHFDQRQSANWDKKREIAQAAAELIGDGETLILDGGSTTYELARLLVNRSLHVVTNSLPVANLFTASLTSELVFIGGNIHSRSGVSLGPYANQMLKELKVRRAVMSIAGINDEGYYNNNLLLVETEQAMMRAADEVLLVADSTKFGHSGLSHIGPLESVHTIVVDSQITDEWRDKLTAAGVRLIVAQST